MLTLAPVLGIKQFHRPAISMRKHKIEGEIVKCGCRPNATKVTNLDRDFAGRWRQSRSNRSIWAQYHLPSERPNFLFWKKKCFIQKLFEFLYAAIKGSPYSGNLKQIFQEILSLLKSNGRQSNWSNLIRKSYPIKKLKYMDIFLIQKNFFKSHKTQPGFYWILYEYSYTCNGIFACTNNIQCLIWQVWIPPASSRTKQEIPTNMLKLAPKI